MPDDITSDSGGGNFWTNKIGPLPLWGWAGLALAAVVAFMYWRQKQSAASASTSTSTDSTSADQVPQFVNQTYVNAYPPTDVDTSPGTGTGGKPPVKKPVGTLPPPGGIHATKTTSSGFTLAWNKVTGATGYRVRITYQSKLVKQQQASGTTAEVSGLGADHTYTVHVASINGAGVGTETNGPAIKTSR